MGNYARLPVLKDETHKLPFTRQTHLVPSPAGDTAEYTRPVGAECSPYNVNVLVFLSDLGSSLGSLIASMPSDMLADTFSASMLSAKPIFLRNVEKALSLCK